MRLYVGGISFSATDEDLAELFSKFSEVASVQIITDGETGHSRGFGFVVIEDEAEAQPALKFDGMSFRGRKLRVNEARPRI